MRILLMILLPIGDTLFATPAIRAVRKRYPEAHITGVVYPTNGGILRDNPDLDRLLEWPTSWGPRGLGRAAVLLRRLRRARFHLAIEFSNYNWWVTDLVGASRCAKMDLPTLWWARPGAGREWRKSHAVEHYADAVRRLGISVDDMRLRLYPTEEDKARAESWLVRHRVGPEELLVAMHPGGEGLWGRKRWPVERFARVADGLSDALGARIVIMGGKEDAALASALAARTHAYIINAVGQTTLGETAALAARCSLFVGNDSSPLHIAASAGTPVVGIYGPTDPRSYHPWVPGGREGYDYAVVRSPAPCAHRFPLVGGITLIAWLTILPCPALEAITVEDVLSAAYRVLEARGLKSAAHSR